MGFNKAAFLSAQFIPREGKVPVEALKQFFDKDSKPVWIVRSLSGPELGQANAAADKQTQLMAKAMLEALHAKFRVKVDSFKHLLGATDDKPADVAKRIEMMVMGSVDPVCDIELAVHVCEKFPIEFYLITNEITKLTGQGHIVGKPKPSGIKKKSSTA